MTVPTTPRRSPIGAIARSVRALEVRTRPVHPDTAAALRTRWAELPPHVRTEAQTLGRHAVGCEGTHGVFPRCNLACNPCYHSRDANAVRVDGAHTRANVSAQFGLLRARRGPRAHAQLIGGEVSLLPPDDHAATLLAMRAHGREPMSMSHGDFDYDYLQRLVLGPDGTPRLHRVSFAGHFDMLMSGRRANPHPSDERSLDPQRRAFTAMFARLRREHGTRTFLAHTMTVTPANVDQIAGVVERCHTYGFGMFSFQPAASVGDARRWREDYRALDGDDVWSRIEQGVGTRLPFRALQTGDERCNRTTHGAYVGPDYFPILDDTDPRDLQVRDVFYARLGGMRFSGTPPLTLAAMLTRVVLRHPSVAFVFGGWAVRMLHRIGARRLLRHHRIRPVTFVMHSFMDAADVAPAWAALRGGTPIDPGAPDAQRLLDTQQRLQACAYTMAHPDTGELVPACVQHGVLDPAENARLRTVLPIPRRRADGA